MGKTVYSIGIGTGDPELITLKAKRLLEESDVIFVPQSYESGKSVAREIIDQFTDAAKLSMFYFPMNNNKVELDRRYAELAARMDQLNGEGKKVCYVTMGDPTIFSTSNYLTEKLRAFDIKVSHVPGINTINAASTMLGLPLCTKGENFGVYEMPTEVDRAMALIQLHSTTIFMKVNKKLTVLLEMVKQSQPEVAFLVRRMGLDDESVFNLLDLDNPPDAAYLSVAYIRAK